MDTNTASNNTAVGLKALQATTTGTQNVAIGAYAGDAVTTGNSNNTVGYQAGSAISTGSNNNFFGDNGNTPLSLPALNGGNGTPNQVVNALPPLAIQNSFTQLNAQGSVITGQETSFFLECITKGATIENLRQQNVNDRVIFTPNNTMAYINIELVGTIIGGTTGFVGKVGFFEYYTVITNIGGRKNHSGLSGGTKEKEIRDSDFAEPTINITTYDGNEYLKLSITHSAGNTTKWFAKVKILLQPIGNPNSLVERTEKAIYQNGTGILLQNYGFLLWN